MSSLIIGGIPSESALYSWNYNNVRVVTTSYGDVYKLYSGAYMAQIKSIAGTMNTAEIIIEYNNASTEDVVGELVFTKEDGSLVAIYVLLPPTEGYETYKTDNVIDTSEVIQFAFELRTTSGQEVLIALIEINVDISTEDSTQASYQDFSKYAILYGLDSAKPNLEVIGNERALSKATFK